MITQSQIDDYSRDGVVLLRGAADAHWIDSLRTGLERQLQQPTERARLWNRAEDGSTTRYDSQTWQQNAEYRDFIFNSGLAEQVGLLMGASRVNFFFDAVFVRSAGCQFRTPFHQDEPYWSVEGFDACSAWMPLVDVEQRSALEFVRGSHRWNRRFAKKNFGEMTGDARDDVRNTDDLEPFPDIEANRGDYEILSWDMAAGDIAVFNARMIHGGSGLLAPDRDLPVFNTQWLGDDVRVCFRPEGMDPDHQDVMVAAGLAPGDRVGGELYPEIWRRG